MLGSYRRLAPRGRLSPSSEARAERDALRRAWAMSSDTHEIALSAIGQKSGLSQTQTLEAMVHFGQITGSIEARETLLQQHLTSDASLFVINEVVPTRESFMWRQVVAWTLKLARDEILKELQSDRIYNEQLLEERLALYKTALAMPALRGASIGKLGRAQPGEAAINYARRSKNGLHSNAADCLSIYQGLRRLAPFALRHTISAALFDRLGDQRLLELAGGLALAEALSVTSGRPLSWNSSIVSDGVIAKVGPVEVGWHNPLDFNSVESQLMVSAKDTRTNFCISIIRCVHASESSLENQVIRDATEFVVASCRNESKKGPRFEETPLGDCAVVVRRLYDYQPEAPDPNRLVITGFDEMARGRFLELARRAYRKTTLK